MASTEVMLLSFLIETIGPALQEGVKDTLDALLGKFSGGQVKKSVGDKCWFQNDKACQSKFRPLCQLSLEKDDPKFSDLENCPYREE